MPTIFLPAMVTVGTAQAACTRRPRKVEKTEKGRAQGALQFVRNLLRNKENKMQQVGKERAMAGRENRDDHKRRFIESTKTDTIKSQRTKITTCSDARLAVHLTDGEAPPSWFVIKPGG